MLKSEVIDFTNKTKFNFSYFEDDPIDVVRHQIANAMNTHPDRLFILVSLRFPNDYYQKDPRRWEKLFDRLSYDGKPIERIPFQEYQSNYRIPSASAGYSGYDKTEWMSKPKTLQELYEPTQEFTELRIFGVEEQYSYVLPFKYDGPLVSRIPSAKYPIPLVTTLLSTLYKPESITGFVAIPYDASAENVQSIYFPTLTAKTPDHLSEEVVGLMTKNAKLLDDLLNYKVYQPRSVAVTRVRFYTEFVDTDFGSAVRTRFEQIFYGLTLSKEVPYIGFFTSKNEISRHKFYVEDTKSKNPYLDLNMWKRWWARKPTSNRPTLIILRGTSKENWDRIAITSTDISMTNYRDDDNTDTIDAMKRETLKWLKSLDAIMAFVEKDDIDSERWEITDSEFYAKYGRSVEDIDPRRLNCISAIFNRVNANESKFNFLRTDRTNYGISPVYVKLIQMLQNEDVKPGTVAQELGISQEAAKQLLNRVQDMLDEDPNLAERAFRNYPTVEIEENQVKVSFVTNIDLMLKYVNLLRYIVGFEDRKLDAICPKRLETIKADTGVAPPQNIEIDQAFRQQFGDLFGFLEQEQETKEEERVPVEVKKTPTTADKSTTQYSYFKEQLEGFDPETFNPNVKGFQYAKKCNQKYQPVVLNDRALDRLSRYPYDPRKYLSENEMLTLENPDGLVICPEYWCMKDDIPLTREQLEEIDGELACPMCGKKVRTSDDDNRREYQVIKRFGEYKYPGFVKTYVSPINKKPLPCCFKTPMKKSSSDVDAKYYIVGPDKRLNEFRISFLQKSLLESLQITETYESIGNSNRLQTGMTGYFRVGLGRPSETLPEIIGLKTKISSPRESVETVLKCSFLRTWSNYGEKHLGEIENKLRRVSPYEKDDLMRQSVAKIISGIDEAFENKTLTILEELEYSAIFLQCDVFRIYTNSNSLGCLFYSPMVRPRSRGIIVLQTGRQIDILCHVSRLSRGFQYKGNVFEQPFKKETYVTLERLRNQACSTKIPNLDTALSAMRDILAMSGEDDFQVILDPFGRGQAFFIRNHMVLPFQPSPLPAMNQSKIAGFSDIQKDDIPTHAKVMEYLEIAKKYSDGYAWEEDLLNQQDKRIEISLKSGLRIPVKPETMSQGSPTEVIETTNQVSESELVFGDPSEDLQKTYKNISYASEVYEFLIFELTKDLEKTEQRKLRTTLMETVPKYKEVEPLLREWFDESTVFIKGNEPVNFISKIRAPCGQFKSENTCSGNMCAWDGKSCKVEVRNVVRKESLFHKLLSTLLENTKIRAMILDGRTTPFFSTVLYLVMPNEVIYTDLDIIDI